MRCRLRLLFTAFLFLQWGLPWGHAEHGAVAVGALWWVWGMTWPRHCVPGWNLFVQTGRDGACLLCRAHLPDVFLLDTVLDRPKIKSSGGIWAPFWKLYTSLGWLHPLRFQAQKGRMKRQESVHWVQVCSSWCFGEGEGEKIIGSEIGEH